MTKHTFRILAALAAVSTAVTAFGAETTDVSPATSGTWSARIRATYLDMANKSDAFNALETDFAANSVRVNSKLIPELDISYNFTTHFSAELVLTIPQTQNVTLRGVGKLGTFKHLPPSLVGQYHFCLPSDTFQPYVGAGVNYTLIWGTNLSVAGLPLSLEHDSIGLVGQAGFDVKVTENGFLNFDVKYVGLQSDVKLGGNRLTTAKLDPFLFSVGYGIRF